jgi:putative ABC transport system permease protein
VFQSISRDYDDRVVKVALPTAHELLDTQGVNLLVLVLDETRNTDRVVRMLAQKLKPLGLEARTWNWLNDFCWKAQALYDRQFGVLQLIVLLMVVVAVVGATTWLHSSGSAGLERCAPSATRAGTCGALSWLKAH